MNWKHRLMYIPCALSFIGSMHVYTNRYENRNLQMKNNHKTHTEFPRFDCACYVVAWLRTFHAIQRHLRNCDRLLVYSELIILKHELNPCAIFANKLHNVTYFLSGVWIGMICVPSALFWYRLSVNKSMLAHKLINIIFFVQLIIHTSATGHW